ncbi:MAG: hypothetical protein GC159_03790 [Phycisphaera sp.]|nr:hypothetical protein [Phycisphaera sp.]
MNIRVGPFRYRIELVAGRIEHDGTLWLAVTDHDRRLIRVSDSVDDADRLRVLIGELMEAWWRCQEAGEADDGTGGLMDALVEGFVDLLDQLAPMLSGSARIDGLAQVVAALRLAGPGGTGVPAGCRLRLRCDDDADGVGSDRTAAGLPRPGQRPRRTTGIAQSK